MDEYKRKLYNGNTRQYNWAIKVDQYLKSQTVTVEVSSCVDNEILQARTYCESEVQQYSSILLKTSEIK